MARSAQRGNEPVHAFQIVLASFAGAGVTAWCCSGSQFRSVLVRGGRVNVSRADDRMDDVCRQWRGKGVFREILSTGCVHSDASRVSGRSGLQTATTSKKTTHEVSAGFE